MTNRVSKWGQMGPCQMPLSNHQAPYGTTDHPQGCHLGLLSRSQPSPPPHLLTHSVQENVKSREV